jgi:hypothetical protein
MYWQITGRIKPISASTKSAWLPPVRDAIPEIITLASRKMRGMFGSGGKKMPITLLK